MIFVNLILVHWLKIMEQIKGKPEYVQMEGEYPPLIQQESLATQSIESAK